MLKLGLAGCLAMMCALEAPVAGQKRPPDVDMAGVMERVGRYIEDYFARAQNVICRETVRIQRLGADLLGDSSLPRQLISELRLAWQPGVGDEKPEITVLRDVLTVNGRPPRPKDDLACMDPRPISPEPLAMLLPDQQRDYAFTWAGLTRVNGRAAAMIDYRSLATGAPVVTRHDDCVSYDLPGKQRGRIWIDQETSEILRLDEGLTGAVDVPVPPDPHRRTRSISEPNFMTIERADVSIRYKRVGFRDPEETLMLPASIDVMSVVRNSGAPRVRTSFVFSDYRRFLTGGRIIQ